MSDDSRGSHASRTVICSSCRDAVYDVSGFPRRPFACLLSVSQFVDLFSRANLRDVFADSAHGTEGSNKHDIIESYTKHTRTQLGRGANEVRHSGVCNTVIRSPLGRQLVSCGNK